ncbi:MAG: cyclase family protein [Hyphomicrobiaceae bacterium]
MRIIDLTTPIDFEHVRWKAERTVKGDLSAGDLFQVTTIKLSVHAFTHVDAQRHFFANGPTIEATPLSAVVGWAKVVDLKSFGPNAEITGRDLEARASHVARGDKVILATAWHRHRSITEETFWRDAPYLTRDAAEWLLDRGVTTVAYDFPQDYVIRLLLDGIVKPIEEHVTHDVLLRAGVHMIEYVTNTDALQSSVVMLSAAPLKIPGADGAPARVYAIEGLAEAP